MKRDQIPDILLEKYLLKELSHEKLTEIEEQIAANPKILERIEMLKKSNTEIMEEYPPEIYSDIINRLYKKEKPEIKKTLSFDFSKIFKTIIPAGSFAAAVAAIIIFGFSDYKSGQIDIRNNIEITRIKGNTSKLYVYRKSASEVKMLKNGDIAKKADLIQLAYRTSIAAYGIIFSIDGRGSVTLQYPEHSSNTTKLKSNEKIYLQNSYELDDAPGFERFFLILSKKEIDIDKFIKKAEEFASGPDKGYAGKINIDDTLEEITFTLNKKEK